MKKIILVDANPELVRAWAQEFSDLPDHFPTVDLHRDSYFDYPADAMVSPANSFGFMDGGIDLAISLHLNPVRTSGGPIQTTVQDMIHLEYHGEMPVGCAKIVKTHVATWPHLVIAPTMRIPENVSTTHNAYLAFRAVLLVVEEWNEQQGGIESLLCCGMGTATGGMFPAVCARQMRAALNQAMGDGELPERLKDIHDGHRAMSWTLARENL